MIPFTASRASFLHFLRSLFFLFCWHFTSALFAQTAIPILRSDLDSLPESIRRETYAAIDRARDFILQKQSNSGLWILPPSSTPVHALPPPDSSSVSNQTCFPLLALCDLPGNPFPHVTQHALSTSQSSLMPELFKPWTPFVAREATYTTLITVFLNQTSSLPPDWLSRFSRIKLESLSSADAAFALLTLDALDRPYEGGWATLVNRFRRAPSPALESVTLTALARFYANPQKTGVPSRDVIEHLRWIANQIRLHEPSPPIASDPLTPTTACFLTLLANQLPRSTWLNDPTLLPPQWRNALANRLLARQLVDPTTGFQYWDSSTAPNPNNPSALRETTFAILTLTLLAQ